jgi:hypothetical protein
LPHTCGRLVVGKLGIAEGKPGVEKAQLVSGGTPDTCSPKKTACTSIRPTMRKEIAA